MPPFISTQRSTPAAPISLSIASCTGNARAGATARTKSSASASFSHGALTGTQQGADLGVGHVHRVARVVDAAEHEADVGAAREAVVDLGVLASHDAHLEAGDVERVARRDGVHLDAVVRAQLFRHRGVGVQPQAGSRTSGTAGRRPGGRRARG